MDSRWLPLVIVAPLIAFGLYRRVSGSFRRQRLATGRMVARMVLLAVVCLVLLALHPSVAAGAAAAGGVVLGAALGLVGLARTTYEVAPEGLFYRTDRWVGLAVTAIFLGRIAMRLVSVAQAQGPSPTAGMQWSPWTIGVFFLLAGYYVTHHAGVLRRARGVSPAPAAVSTTPVAEPPAPDA